MSKMSTEIGAISFSHQNTTLAERDLLAFSSSEIEQSLAIFRDKLGGEVGILSTCNRTEFYASGACAPTLWEDVKDLVAGIKGVRPTRLPVPHQFYGAEAARHLFRVSASLESLALGEDQILAQVKDAHEHLLGAEEKSPVLDQLFQLAVRAGKDVRTNTTLCQGNVSISSVSVELAKKIFGQFKRFTILLVGAGETGVNAGVHFRAAGAKDFIIVNRGQERGEAVAEQFDGEYMPLHRLSDACVRADIVVFATGAQHPLLDLESMRNIMRARRNRQILLIDISNPRNVDPRAGEPDGVFLYNIDHLESIVQENLQERTDQIPLAETILESYVDEWDAYLRARRVTPTIAALSKHFKSVRQQELDHFRNKISEGEYELLEEFSKRLIKKLQHNPIIHLRKSAASNELRSEDLDLVIKLHGLLDDDS